MKRKKSIKKLIMQQFVFFAALMMLSLTFIQVAYITSMDAIASYYQLPYDIPYSDIPATPKLIVTMVMAGALVLIVISFCVITQLFGKRIGKKIQTPVEHIVKGLRRVTKEEFDYPLCFETETEFSEMRDAFNQMATMLSQVKQARVSMEEERMQLFSNIAHDLKTPITIISAYAGALENGLVVDDEKQQEYYNAIKVKSGQINHLVDQLLTYSKMGSIGYRLHRTKVDISELVRACCASLFGVMEERQIALELVMAETPVYGVVDSAELVRAVDNLLTNSIQHTPLGSLLLVRLSEDDNNITLEIADNGPPIPENIQKTLFEPFVSGSCARTAGSGTGLGLAIVQKIAKQHDGLVCIKEHERPYTKMFVLRIPAGV